MSVWLAGAKRRVVLGSTVAIIGGDLAGWTTGIVPGSLAYLKPRGLTGGTSRHAIGLALVVPESDRHEVALDQNLSQG